MAVMEAVAAGCYVRAPESRRELRRLERDELPTAGLTVTVAPAVTPRGEQLVQILHGLLPGPVGE